MAVVPPRERHPVLKTWKSRQGFSANHDRNIINARKLAFHLNVSISQTSPPAKSLPTQALPIMITSLTMISAAVGATIKPMKQFKDIRVKTKRMDRKRKSFLQCC